MEKQQSRLPSALEHGVSELSHIMQISEFVCRSSEPPKTSSVGRRLKLPRLSFTTKHVEQWAYEGLCKGLHVLARFLSGFLPCMTHVIPWSHVIPMMHDAVGNRAPEACECEAVVAPQQQAHVASTTSDA